MAVPPRLPNLRNLARLTNLTLFSIRLDQALLDDISQLGGLQSLKLSECCLNGRAVDRLAPLRHLTTLDLEFNDLDDSAIPALARVPKNVQLDIDSNPIDDTAVDRLKKLRPDLDISINSRKDAMSDFQHQIASVATSIRATTSNLGDGDIGLLMPAANRLKQLNLQDTHLTDVGLATIAKLPHLESLDLQGTQITDAGLVQLDGLRELRAINLSSTAIVEQGDSPFAKSAEANDAMPPCGRHYRRFAGKFAVPSAGRAAVAYECGNRRCRIGSSGCNAPPARLARLAIDPRHRRRARDFEQGAVA